MAGYQIQTVDAVFGANAGHFGHHVDFREMEMRAVVIVVGARRDQFDGVGAEDNHVAEILFENRGSPGVVGVDLGAIADLMASQLVFRGGRDVEIVVDGGCVMIPAEGAEEAADAEQSASFVVALDVDGVRADGQVEAFGGAGVEGVMDFNCRAGAGRPVEGGAMLDLFDEHLHGFFFGASEVGVGGDSGVVEVEGLDGGGDEKDRAGGTACPTLTAPDGRGSKTQ